MCQVDRADFYPLNPARAYEDSPQSIGFNVTISAPHMHAYCLEWLKGALKPGASVLDVGSGSGYLCAAFFEMIDREGLVVGVDHIQELVDQSLVNLNAKYSLPLRDG